MNTCNFIVKIISPLEQRIVADDIFVVEAQAQFPKIRKKKGFEQFKLAVWENLGKDFLQYYTVGDYIIVQGILSFLPGNAQNQYKKEAKLTVLKLYPFLLAD